MHDFGEALYVTAVTAGVPRAVAATRVLLDVFAEDRSPCHVMPGPRPSI
jgi:alkylhydroperoxidase/carboxymuconolactone decarboxylase family protein YurZ